MIDRAIRCGALSLLAWLATPARARGQQIVQLESRPGVKQFYLLLDEPGETYKAAVIYFPGSGQELGLAANGIATYNEQNGNFLARSWRNSKSKIVVAIVDPPSDLEGRFTSQFRMDKRHVTDISAIVRDLKARFPGIRVFLIGLSTGAISVANAGAQLGGQVSGIVLMSSVLSLGDFDFVSIKAPILFVYHVDDECVGTPYDNAKSLAGKYSVISASGGDPPESGPCGPKSAHTYFGIRGEVANAVADWMFGRRFPREVHKRF